MVDGERAGCVQLLLEDLLEGGDEAGLAFRLIGVGGWVGGWVGGLGRGERGGWNEVLDSMGWWVGGWVTCRMSMVRSEARHMV